VSHGSAIPVRLRTSAQVLIDVDAVNRIAVDNTMPDGVLQRAFSVRAWRTDSAQEEVRRPRR
jgi:hypothetical protein